MTKGKSDAGSVVSETSNEVNRIESINIDNVNYIDSIDINNVNYVDSKAQDKNHNKEKDEVSSNDRNKEENSVKDRPKSKNRNKPEDKISIICWNIRGLGDKLKYQDIQSLLFQNDIIILTETHSEPGMEQIYNCIPGYTYKDFPRKHKHQKAPCASGGIGIFARCNIIEGIDVECQQECIVWVKLKAAYFKSDKDITLGCVYFSPADSSYIHSTTTRTDYFNILNEQVSTRNNSVTLLCGDFNARTGNACDYVECIPGKDGDLHELLGPTNTLPIPTNSIKDRNNRDKNVNEYGRQLLSFCKSSSFLIMNGRTGNISNTGDFTCYKTNGGASAVDYLICRQEFTDRILNFSISAKHPDSDHRPLIFEVSLPKVPKCKLRCRNEETQVVYKWDSSKIQIYEDNLSNEKSLTLQDMLIVESSCPYLTSDRLTDIFYDLLNNAISSTFKKKKRPQSKFPINVWFDEECKMQKKIVHDYAKQNNITDPIHAQRLNTLEKEYKRIVQRNKRRYLDDVRYRLGQCTSKNPAVYWGMWKSLKPHTVNNSSLTLDDFETYFKTQITPPNISYFEEKHMQEIHNLMSMNDFNQIDNTISNEICNSIITEDEIRHHLSKLKNKKASGYDGFVGEFFKCAPSQMVPILNILFNSIFEKGEWPEKWATGLISPVHKKNSINSPDNYRKITVMPVIGKVLESILNARLAFKNIALELDDPCQFGFKQGCRTTDNIFILQSLLENQTRSRQSLWVCFVDFTKAFDYVNRIALYHKLVKQGVNGKLLRLIIDLYDKAKCKVKWKGSIGNQIESEYGVLQGGMMSPKLFTEYLGDLGEFLDENQGVQLGSNVITHLLYADDMVLCSKTPTGLQKLIDGLYEFCRKWHLIVSLSKTNVMVLGNKKQHGEHQFKFGDEHIAMTEQYNYLGVILSSKGKIFKNNTSNLSVKAKNAEFALGSFVKTTVGHLQPQLAMKMFDVQISPILEYGSEVWFKNKDIVELEKIHLNHMKQVLKVKTSTATPPLYAELGRFPLSLKMKMRLINYWKRILEYDDTNIVKQAYLQLLELYNSNQKNWCDVVREILKEARLEQCWHNQTMNRTTLAQCKEALHQNFMNKCMNDINDSEKYTKLRTYKLFKKEFCLENYLTLHDNINNVINIFRFRSSSHNLAIETGRYTRPKTPIDDRKCIHCNLNQVEDEQHFLLECSLYDNERTKLLQVIRQTKPNIDHETTHNKFCIIMSLKEVEIIKELGKYITDCMKKRSIIIVKE